MFSKPPARSLSHKGLSQLSSEPPLMLNQPYSITERSESMEQDGWHGSVLPSGGTLLPNTCVNPSLH